MTLLYTKSKNLSPILKSKEFKNSRWDVDCCAECPGIFFRLETVYLTTDGEWICEDCAELRDDE